MDICQWFHHRWRWHLLSKLNIWVQLLLLDFESHTLLCYLPFDESLYYWFGCLNLLLLGCLNFKLNWMLLPPIWWAAILACLLGVIFQSGSASGCYLPSTGSRHLQRKLTLVKILENSQVHQALSDRHNGPRLLSLTQYVKCEFINERKMLSNIARSEVFCDSGHSCASCLSAVIEPRYPWGLIYL